MTLTITDRLIRGMDTRHAARRTPGSDPAEWRVTWLTGRTLTQDQAVAEMTHAERFGQLLADCDPEIYDDKFWTHTDALAAALGMSGPDAVVRASESGRCP